MKKPEAVTDDKGNIYVVPGRMNREEAEVYFPNQSERSKREDSFEEISEWGSKGTFGLLPTEEMRCSEHCGNTVRRK